MGIQVLVILAWMKGAIFLGDKKEWRGLWRFRWDNMSRFQMFVDEGLACFHLLRVQGINFGNFQGKGWFEVNDMVIRLMWRELVMSLF